MDERLLLLPEVANIARASLSSVRAWVLSGRLKSHRPGRRRLVRETDLQAFLTGAPRSTPRVDLSAVDGAAPAARVRRLRPGQRKAAEIT